MRAGLLRGRPAGLYPRGLSRRLGLLQLQRGDAYSQLLSAGSSAALEQARTCYQAALHLFSCLQMDRYAAIVDGALNRLRQMPGLERPHP